MRVNAEENIIVSLLYFFGYFVFNINESKCHFRISEYKYESTWVKIGQTKIWESKKQKLSGVIIDRDLKVDEYVLSICKSSQIKSPQSLPLSELSVKKNHNEIFC